MTNDRQTTPPPLTWRSTETAPEHPREEYLAVDILGHVHVTRHPRSTLLHAGWACGWHPMKGEPLPDDGLSAQEGGMAIAAVHAREFRRLLTAHRMPPDTVIKGVKLA